MKRKLLYRSIGLTASTLALGILSACGGGAGTSLDVADGGIRGTGSSVGPVSGFGSVFVNGVRFDTSGAEIASNDGVICEPDQNCTQPIEKGMILQVAGEWQDDFTGTAVTVEYDDTFRGPVSGVAQTTDSDGTIVRVEFEILGQRIIADKQTVFSKTTLTDLADGNFVRVSAWPLADGQYRAAFVGISSAADQVSIGSSAIEIEGRVTELNQNLNTFRINGTLVQYPNTTDVFKDGLVEGDLDSFAGPIEVEGEIALINGEEGIDADVIGIGEIRRYDGDVDSDIEFVGPIADGYDSDTGTLTVNGLTVIIPSADVLEEGLTLAGLIPGRLIQVEGDVTSEGQVLAEEIESREVNAEITGAIDSILENGFALGGVEIRLTSNTLLSDDDDGTLSIAELQPGVGVEVEGVERVVNDSVFVEAVKIEREDVDDPNSFEMQGRLAFMTQDPDYIEVLGVRLRDSEAEYEEDEGSRLSLLNAYSKQVLFVEVEYIRSGEEFVADEIELEED